MVSCAGCDQLCCTCKVCRAFTCTEARLNSYSLWAWHTLPLTINFNMTCVAVCQPLNVCCIVKMPKHQ